MTSTMLLISRERSPSVCTFDEVSCTFSWMRPIPSTACCTAACPDAGRRGGRLERGGGEILARGTELVRQLCGLAVTPLPLALTQGLLVEVDQQHVSHQCASVRRRLSLREVLTPCPPLREILTPRRPSPEAPTP